VLGVYLAGSNTRRIRGAPEPLLDGAALPSEDAVLRLFFGLWVSGQIKLRRIRGYRDMGSQQEGAA